MRSRDLQAISLIVLTSTALTLLLTAGAQGYVVAAAHAGAQGAVRIRLGVAELVAPRGALRPRQLVAVRRIPSPSPDSGAGFTFDVGRQGIKRPVQIVLPLAKHSTPADTLIVMYRGGGGRWYAVAGKVTRTGNTIQAWVSHLSTWAALDLTRLIEAAFQDSIPARSAAVTNDCPDRSDPRVGVLGMSGPVSLCVARTQDDTHDEVTLTDHGPFALTIALSSGLDVEPLTDGQFGQGYVFQDSSVPLIFDATTPTATITYSQNLIETAAGALAATVLAKIAGPEYDDVIATLAACSGHYATTNDNATAAKDAAECLIGGAGEILIGGIAVGDVAVNVIAALINKALPNPQTVHGAISLVTSLPAVGGASSGTPPGSPPVSANPSPPEPPSPSFYADTVTGTCADGACGLHIRSGPGYSEYSAIGVLGEGAEVDIVCQAAGETVGPSPSKHTSSDIWDRLTNGGWVSDLYISTPNTGTWSPPIPQC
jgi:hypothetical protein